MEEHRRKGHLSCELYSHHDHPSHLRIIYTLARCIIQGLSIHPEPSQKSVTFCSAGNYLRTSHQPTKECCQITQGTQRTQKNRMS